MKATAIILFVVCVLAELSFVAPNALDDYVYKADPSYKYTILPDMTRRVEGKFTAFVLNMTSQTWLTAQTTNHPVWWHYLTVIVPDNIFYPDTGFIYTTGGSNKDSPPDPLLDEETVLLSKAVVTTGIIGGVLKMNPNQPIVFRNDPQNKSRTEDSIIAYTWRYYLEVDDSNPDILVQFAMTKSVVKAMDTMVDFRSGAIKNFFVAGASKRGWATWLTGCVDKRVIGIAPLVFDLLDMQTSLHHHFRSLGGWTFAFSPYWEEDVTKYLDNLHFPQMAQFIDPLSYRDRLTMPKYIVTSGGDEFFLVDDSHYFYNKMEGPTLLRIHPNAEHTLILHHLGLMEELGAFMMSVKENRRLPIATWQMYENNTHGVIIFNSDMKPTMIKGYEAVTLSTERRDFRLAKAKAVNSTEIAVQPVLYRAFDPKHVSANQWIAEVPLPTVGWKCFFVVANYDGPRGSSYAITSQPNIVPNTFPFPECHGDGCTGSLV